MRWMAYSPSGDAEVAALVVLITVHPTARHPFSIDVLTFFGDEDAGADPRETIQSQLHPFGGVTAHAVLPC
jgi:hypothetical protein